MLWGWKCARVITTRKIGPCTRRLSDGERRITSGCKLIPPRVAEACLVDGITYDADNLQLVKTYAADGLRREASYVRLELKPADPA